MNNALVLHDEVDNAETYFQNPYQFEQFTVYQVGEKVLDSSSYEYSWVVSRYFHLGMLFGTSGHVKINGEHLDINDILLIPPHTEIKLQGLSDTHYAFVEFKIHDVPSTIPLTAIKELKSALIISEKMTDGSMREVLVRLVNEIRQQNVYTQLLVGSYLNQILVAVSKYISIGEKENNSHLDKKITCHSQAKSKMVQQAMSYIDNQYMQLRDLREIAQNMGYSYSYLSHVFRAEVGVCLQTYYTNKKIAKAMQMLCNQESVTSVAEKLQYKSIHSFSKAFKKITGISPSDYQQKKEQIKMFMYI